jgi:hypothetical protein
MNLRSWSPIGILHHLSDDFRSGTLLMLPEKTPLSSLLPAHVLLQVQPYYMSS